MQSPSQTVASTPRKFGQTPKIYYSKMQEDIKNIKQHLSNKFGPKYESLVAQEILSAINGLKGSKAGIENKQKLSLTEIEERIQMKIERRSQVTGAHSTIASSTFRKTSPRVNFRADSRQGSETPKQQVSAQMKSAVQSALSSLECKTPVDRNSNKMNKIQVGYQNLMQSQESFDRFSPMTGKKLISGGYGANGIPHGIENQKMVFMKSPKAKQMKKQFQRMMMDESIEAAGNTAANQNIWSRPQHMKTDVIAQSLPQSQLNIHSRTEAMYSTANLMSGQKTASSRPQQNDFQSTIKKEVKNLGFGEVSKTLRSTLMPHSYNITPSQEVSTPNMILRKLGQSLHNRLQDSVAKGEYKNSLNLNANDTHRRALTQGKYEINQTIKGQSVGGPGKKPKISMWDMITLYDTQKKRAEDEEAYLAHKQQQQELKSFYESQMDFKKQVRNYEMEVQNKELQDLKSKQQNLHRYEQSFERKKKNFLSLLSEDNKKMTQAHSRMQTIQARTTKNGVLNDLRHKSIEHGVDLQNSLDLVNKKKKAILKDQQNEIREKIYQQKEKDLVELKKNLNEMNLIDRDFQIRELKLAQHHQKIAERDSQIFQIYNSPQQITFTKYEVNKNIHVGELNEALKRKEQQRIQNQAEDRAQKKLQMLNEMIMQNNVEKQRQKEQFKNRAQQKEQIKRIKGSVGRVNQFTAPQVAEIKDQQHKLAVKKLQAKNHMAELQRQMQDKHLREETQRLYLDQKEMATSGSIMQKVNPALFQKVAQDEELDSPEKLLEDEKLIEEECKKLNKIKFSQHFLPTTLRAQRFKD